MARLMRNRERLVLSLAVVFVCLAPAGVSAQDEEVEPRIVGNPGATLVGVSGFLDRFYSSEDSFTTNYTVQVDLERFVTKRFAVRFGVNGSGQFGGSASSDDESGRGAPAVHVLAGVLFFLKPASIISPYVGTEYWVQVSRRPDRDAGSVVGKAGFQAAVSSRASFFVEGGFGLGLTKGSDGALFTRVVGQLGVRLKWK